MIKQFTFAMGTLALLASSVLSAHDPRLHRENASTGEVVAVSKDGFDLKTKTDTVRVKLSKTTKFELDGKEVSKSPVSKGQRVGVIGTKSPGSMEAEQVIVLPATNPAPASK